MITLSRVSKAHGTDPLFRDVTFSLLPGRRVALLGSNGAGKTTLLEIILGRQDPDDGEVNRAKGVRIGYLPQDVAEPGEGTVLEEVLEGAGEILALEKLLRHLEHQLGETTGAEHDAVLERYGNEQHRFEQLGGYEIEAEAHRVLAGLGFAPEDADRPVRELSGGWRVRVALARLLLSKPDLLILDEPTNHLDIESIAWLERTLVEHPGALLFVSHDRDFIEAVADRVVELAHRTATEYVGSFSDFVEQRELRMEGLRAAQKQQQRELADTERFIERFRYKASKAKQVQSRVKRLEKVDRIEVPEDHDPKVRFGFPTPRRASRVVLSLEGVTKRFDDTPVFTGLDLTIERGWKIGVVGPNGAGKSTLLNLILGLIEPDEGTVTLGTNVDVAHFAQHQVDALRQDRRVVEEFSAGLSDEHRGKNVRTMLGAFGFSGDAGDQEVQTLSGGEQTRLALGRLMANAANLLCLDEPTNHLDISSRDLLEDALVAYPGTVLLITHDRHVIRGVADHILDVRDGTARLHPGGYEEFLERVGTHAATPASGSALSDGRTGARSKAKEADPARDKRREAEHRNQLHRVTKPLRREVTKLEAALEKAEAEVAELTRAMADPAVYEDPRKVAELVAAHGRAKDLAGDLMQRWEAAQLELEAAEAGIAG
ncbi:MAG: ATP-binding cassette domain-containing protein [Actinobacteria bacterium]|nr:ATP-binding cassette domain-containing protein [Actinomycetota bacterium]